MIEIKNEKGLCLLPIKKAEWIRRGVEVEIRFEELDA